MSARTRVLVVEDVADIRRTTTLALDHAGFEVLEATTGAEALALIEGRIDVVLLDRGLPDVDGISLIPRIRARHPGIHITVVSGSGSEADRVEGLLAGADDYVVKPASMPELIARVTSAARRIDQGRAEVLQFDDLVIDLDRRLVIRGGQPIDLTRQEFELLGHLARNPERAVSRAELLEAAWTSSASWQSAATVTEHVRRVRKKVEHDPSRPRWIQSVRGVGYRFKASHTRPSGPTPPHTAIVLLDGLHIVDATADAIHLLGASGREEVVGQPVADFIAPRSVAALGGRRTTAEASQWPRPEIVTLRRVDGSEVHVEIASMPSTWHGRTVRQAMLWPIEGRTERLRELVTGIGGDVPDAVVITDTMLRIESFNRAAETLYGWREEEVIGQRITEVIPWVGEASDLVAAADALERDHRWHGHARQRRRDGRTIEVMASTTLLSDEAGRTIGVISVNRPAPGDGRSAVGIGPVHAGGVIDPQEHALADDIVRGIDADEFAVVYQPIVKLADRTISGVEALVRWNHPDRGLLTPVAFIDVAERTGAIVELGRHVLHVACAQLGRWRDAGHDLHLAVNLSARQLADAQLAADVERAVLDNRLAEGTVWLEVTESALVEDLDVATSRLEALRALGTRISIDDFGTGWASLTYLHQFPIDALKVDSVFVKGLEEKASAKAIVRSVVSLGHELDIAVVAEGIETERQLAALRSLGCTVGQGFLFAKPADASAIGLST